MSTKTFNVKLKDGSYELLFDNAAFYEFEEIHRTTAIQVVSRGDIGFRAVTNLIYAGLLHGEQRIPLNQVKKIIPSDLKAFQKVTEAVMAAVDDALDTGDGESAKNEKADRQK